MFSRSQKNSKQKISGEQLFLVFSFKNKRPFINKWNSFWCLVCVEFFPLFYLLLIFFIFSASFEPGSYGFLQRGIGILEMALQSFPQKNRAPPEPLKPN